MRLTHELISSDVVDLELIELKFIFDRSKRVRYSAVWNTHKSCSSPRQPRLRNIAQLSATSHGNLERANSAPPKAVRGKY